MSDSASKTLEDQAPKEASSPNLDAKTVEEEKPQEDGGQSENVPKAEGEEEEEEEEEEGECGFCLFMKGGGCKETFEAWEQCVEESEKKNEDIVEKCFQVTSALKKCMEVHSDYYEPILKAEKAAEEEVVLEMEKEKASGSSERNPAEEVVVLELEKEKASESSEQNGAASEKSKQHSDGKRDG